jgi:hypothetical protein
MNGGIALHLRRATHAVGPSRILGTQGALAPLWAGLAFNELPPTATVIGGALILTALARHFVGELRDSA